MQAADGELGQQRVQQRIDSASTAGSAEPIACLDLPELAIAAGLGALVAEEQREVPELHRLRELVHPVLEEGARGQGRCPRGAGSATARPRPGTCTSPLTIRSRCQRRARRARSPRRPGSRCAGRPPLEIRRAARSTCSPRAPARAARRTCPQGLEARRRRRASRGACFGPRLSAPVVTPRRGPAGNGFVARSRPSVVRPMCPGCTTASSSKRSRSVRDRRQQRPASPPGRSVQADRALEQHVAGEQVRRAVLVGGGEGHMAGAVAGRRQHLQLQARELELLVALGAPRRRRRTRTGRSRARARRS